MGSRHKGTSSATPPGPTKVNERITMPFKPVELPKCPKCDKSVYAAEEKLAGGHKWHKACFKCTMCNKMLDSTSCAEHEGALYCKVCHGRKFGPKGYGFGGGAGALNSDTGEKFGNTEFQTNKPIDPTDYEALMRK